MGIVVGYLATPEGRAALDAAVQEANIRGRSVVVVVSSRADEPAEHRALLESELAGVAENLTAQGVPHEVRLLDGYQGAGRAEIRLEELETVLRIARLEGLVLDPVYTAKAFGGLLATLRRDPRALGRRVCFVHTGGVFSVFPHRAALGRLSDGDPLVNS